MTLVCRDLDLDPKRYPPRGAGRPGQQPEERAGRRGDVRGQAANGLEKALAEAYALYQRRLREANALDFDDLIMTTVHLLQAFPDVAEHYRRRFRHVLVDEYQDTNHAQYMLVKRAGRPGTAASCRRPSCASSATPTSRSTPSAARRSATSSSSSADYPDATTILLEQNYRSTQTILTAANAVIDRNTDRKPKHLWTDAGAGEQIVGYVADNEHDEAAVRRRRDRPADRRRTRSSPATSRSSTAPTRSPGSSRRCSSGSACPTRSSAACASTSARRSATRWPTCGCSPTPTTRSRCAASSTPRARHRRPGRGVRRGARRARADLLRRGAARGPTRRPAWRPASAERDRRLRRADGRAARAGRRPRRPAEVLEAVLRPHRLPRRAGGEPPTRRTRPGWRTSRSWSASPGSSSRTGRGRRGAATLADFLEQVSLVADADQIPDDDRTTAAWSR